MSVTPSAEPSIPAAAPPSAPTKRRGWTAGRIVSLVIGCILGLVSLGLLGAGGFATWATNTQRDAAGYLTSGTQTIATPGHAITSDQIDFWTATDWATPADVVGTIRIRATATNPAAAVFIGVAPKAAVDSYLTGVNRQVVTGWSPFETQYRGETGAAPKTAPIDARIWTAQVSGPGTQTLTWRPTGGTWTIVVMHPNGSAGLSVTADMGATIPDLAWFAVGLFVVGGLLLGAAVALIAVPVARASR
jgi:hypothetical protein